MPVCREDELKKGAWTPEEVRTARSAAFTSTDAAGLLTLAMGLV